MNQPSDKNKTNQSILGRFQGQFGCSSWLVWILLIALLVPWALQFLRGDMRASQTLSYTDFRQRVEDGRVKSVDVSGSEVRGQLTQAEEMTLPTGDKTTYDQFVTYISATGQDDLVDLLEQHNVDITFQPADQLNIGLLLLNFFPFLLLIGLGYFMLQRMRGAGGGEGGIFSMGKSRARLYDRQQERTTFSDVAGAAGAKRELEEIVGYLKDPSKYSRLGGSIPKGVLLVGPPGTGKTLLARAVAGEANAPFFSITGSDFMEMFVGVGASRVRDLFAEAKKAAPSIIFIDEIDSIGRRRGAGVGGGHDEREQTLNQLLSELDGFEPSQNVIVMAATNRPDILDPALLRPGRFDRQITVDLPTYHDRVEILKIHSRNKPLAEDADLETVARSTPGFSGADLANLLNEAALLAARQNKNKIGAEDIGEARDKVIMGLERENIMMSDNERRLLAYHEAGHALIAAMLPNADPVHKVTIIPRGRAMGVTMQLPERDRYLYSREYMLDRMAVMMGGRAAEQVSADTMTSGAQDDLKQATRLARKMVLDWGMSPRLGPVSLGGDDQEVFLGEDLARTRAFSDQTAHEVDLEVRAILEEAYDQAKTLLIDNRESLDRIVEVLLAEEQISGADMMKLIREPGQEIEVPVDVSQAG